MDHAADDAAPAPPPTVEQLAENALRQLGALGEQPQERLERQRRADGDPGRLGRGLLRHPFENLVETDRRRPVGSSGLPRRSA
jgi:hypothetical protein